ncbi:hypothetical protein [Isoptericola sp. NPDC057391]|uniref:hypothetical protein n=1 Tax=Isoptericola sp. NPDC057391 TaxID=3346117 RepID=UPI0036321227
MLGVAAGGTAVVIGRKDGDPPAEGPPGSSDGINPGALPKVASLVAEPEREEFGWNEQACAPYLVSLAAIANGIDDSLTSTRGAFTGGWWRTPASVGNARTSELVSVLSWFATRDRPWNAYLRDEALLARLNAGVDRYLALQHPGGAWPEYAPDEESLAATAFAMNYLTRTLVNLRKTDALADLHAPIVRGVRRAARWFLDPDNAAWQDPTIQFSNQVLAGLTGAAKAIRHDPDRELSMQLDKRISDTASRIQSPAGFLYEDGGSDVGYNLSVSLPLIAELHDNLGRTPLLPQVQGMVEWLSLAMVPEPDGSGLIPFDAPSTRTPMAYLDATARDGDPRDLAAHLLRRTPGLAPFFTTQEERHAQRAQWASSSDSVGELEPGATNPRVVDVLDLPQTLPPRAQKQAATAQMPMIIHERFTELRRDAGQHYLFVRRPSYYAQAFLGERPPSNARTGLALLWHPGGGTFIHAGSGGGPAWGVTFDDDRTEATADLPPEYLDVNEPGRPVPTRPSGVADARTLQISWSACDGALQCTTTWHDDQLQRSIVVGAPATEQIPLLLRADDTVTWADESGVWGALRPPSSTAVAVRRGGTTLTISWDRPLAALLQATDRWYFADRTRRTHLLRIRVWGRTDFCIRLHDGPAPTTPGDVQPST